jgi:prepilin peptidase CpaA
LLCIDQCYLARIFKIPVIEVAEFLALLGLATVACFWDLRERRVPNFLTLPVAIFGLVLALTEGGWSGGGWALAGLVAGGGLFFPFVFLGYIGAGDMKLMAAAGTILGPLGIARGLLAGAILGGLWAAGWMVVKKDRKATLPYAPPLAIGIVIAFFY